MTGDSWDELLAEARKRLQEQEDDDPNAELGDDMTPSPEAYFAGRWRGVGRMVTKERGTIGVFLVWGDDGSPGFLYQHAKLVQEVDDVGPEVGDEVLVLRGPTEFYEKDGEERKRYRYSLRKRPCSDPLPEQPQESQLEDGDKATVDDDLPFLCPDGKDSRSVPAAVAGTG